MLNTSDYKAFFDQLYLLEEDMEREGRALLKIVRHPEAQRLLRLLIADERRHKRIVKSFYKIL
ncbi:MAG: hypothetical protein AAB869_04280 [Patescibacteria group bacterium]